MVKELSPEVRNCYYDSTFSDKKMDSEMLICLRRCSLSCATVPLEHRQYEISEHEI